MDLKIADIHTSSAVMDHHGLVAATCRDLQLSERINARIGSNDPRRVVQPGVAVMAMIINGLGFTNRRLYLTPQFFESKCIEQLFEEDIKAEQLDDHALGKALDEIAKYGSSQLFGEIAFDIAKEHGLLGKLSHLDSTSFTLHGQYENTEANAIEVTHGYSKDHRPDLKQVMLSMAVSGEAQIPFWMEPQDGNSSDKKSFHQTISCIKAFQSELKHNDAENIWVADSALYNKEGLLSSNAYRWISRVPESIKEAKSFLEQATDSFNWVNLDKGYCYSPQTSCYGGIEQRWLLIYSEQAYQREKKTFDRRLQKQQTECNKALWHLGNQIFSCQADALKAHGKIASQYRYHAIEANIEKVAKHMAPGRPKTGEVPQKIGFKVQSEITIHQEKVNQYLNRKGRFIIATNNLDVEKLTHEALLLAYKDQQGVERGFRFLKDPWFMVDSFFIKKRSRIEALMMVMTLCLLVYNFTQHKLRKALAERNETLPNQLNKSVNNPTLRWIFQLMEGIAIIKIYDPVKQLFNAIITNLNELRIKIIRLMGKTSCNIYGIDPEIAGM